MKNKKGSPPSMCRAKNAHESPNDYACYLLAECMPIWLEKDGQCSAIHKTMLKQTFLIVYGEMAKAKGLALSEKCARMFHET